MTLQQATSPVRIEPVVSQEHTRHLLAHGYAVVDALWTSAFAQSLAVEAERLIRRAVPAHQVKGPPPQATAAEAPLLSWLQFALLPTARALTGQVLVPICGWYNFYPVNDGIWLHVDVDDSDLVILATALGEVGPLHLHPQLQGLNQAELDVVYEAPSWNDTSGTPVAYPPLGIVAHRGRMVPHHRPGRPVRSPSAVAALHFKSIW
ncbi:hypothetical protein ACGFYQ_40640 [Streptomyces sp. NPDC048258]|uniref:hypothetical protein n=1 Tax=Streptomyces sp. NPDC048258 TaxID=3365527 RepID=UPI0037116CC8